MIIAFWVLGICSSLLLLFAAIAFFRAKDLFVMLHIIKINNFYFVPLTLLAVEVERFSWVSLSKIMVIIALNILTTHFICYTLAKTALADKIMPDADFKK